MPELAFGTPIECSAKPVSQLEATAPLNWRPSPECLTEIARIE